MNSCQRILLDDAKNAILADTNGQVKWRHQVLEILQKLGGFSTAHCQVIFNDADYKHYIAYKTLFFANLKNAYTEDEIFSLWMQIHGNYPERYIALEQEYKKLQNQGCKCEYQDIYARGCLCGTSCKCSLYKRVNVGCQCKEQSKPCTCSIQTLMSQGCKGH